MRDYDMQRSDIVNSAHGKFPCDASPVTSAKVDTKRPALSSSSRMSLLTSSTISLAQRQFLEWPEFEENYNSIMDNTNLLDSCAAALSDITAGDDDRSFANSFEHRCHVLRQASSSEQSLAKTSSTGSLVTRNTADSMKRLSRRVVQQFIEWLQFMEKRIELLPTLGKIFTMNENEMAAQYNIHKGIFKEIVGQPCIVKGSSHIAEYKVIEERYHLLYLKVYEVLLLLEDVPDFESSDRGNGGGGDRNNSAATMIDSNTTHNVYTDSSSLSDKSESLAVDTSIYTRTNILSRSIGTFYFNHDDTTSEQTSSDKRTLSECNLYEANDDKDCEWKTDVKTLLFSAVDDSHCSGFDACTLAGRQSSLQRQLCQEDPLETHILHEHLQQQQNHQQKRTSRRYTIDNCTPLQQQQQQQRPLSVSVPMPMQLTAFDRRHSIDTIDHKVREWLNSKTMYGTTCKSKSSWTNSMDAIDSDVDDLHALYRSKSDLNLPIYRCLSAELRTSFSAIPTTAAAALASSTFRASVNGLPLIVVANDTSSLCDTTSVESLEWDCFEPDLMASPNGMANNDNEISALSEQLCYFGEDYSQQLVDGDKCAVAVTTLLAANEANRVSADSSPDQMAAQQDGNEVATGKPKKRHEPRRKQKMRRAKKKAFRAISRMSAPCDADQPSVKCTADASTETEPLGSCCKQSETFETLVAYNSSSKQFEWRADETVEAKTVKVSEMRPEHFHKLVAVCRTNIDCVITVLAAEPNRKFDPAYCRQMTSQRNVSKEATSNDECKCQLSNGHDVIQSTETTVAKKCKCVLALQEPSQQQQQQRQLIPKRSCVCSEINNIICIVLSFLVDCWNIFRNMKLYMYLSRFVKTLFDSTRSVADHLRAKANNGHALKYH